MKGIGEGVVTVILAIIGLAIIAILVSKKANTSGVIQSIASGLGNNIGVAGAPVTGQSFSIDLSYPSSGGIADFGNSFGG